MPFSRSSLQTIIDRILSDFQTRIEGASSLLRRSVLGVIARIVAGVVHLLYEYLDYMSKQLFATTSDSAGLDAIASEYGVVRKAAEFAVGSGAIIGTTGILIPEGSELVSTNGYTYTTDADVTLVAGAGTLAFTAGIGGEDANDDAGITLTFVSPIAGVNTSVTVDADGISGGTDKEIDSSLRERVLARKRQPPHGGADFDYITWAKEVAGVTRAWCFPQYNGVGTVGVAFVRDDDSGSIVPSLAERAIVEAYIIEHEDPYTGETVGIPVTAEPGLEVITITELAVNFVITLSPNTSAVQDSIEENLEDLLLRDGGPGETVYLSNINEAISQSIGEVRHVLTSPILDSTATNTQVHVLGTVTFNDY